MVEILSNRGFGALMERNRSSIKKSNPWLCVDKRAVAFSIWTGRSLLLRKPVDTSHIQKRTYGMLVARAVRGVLKIRYLLLGGAVGGGMTLNKKYAEWKDGLPDMGWLNDLLPDNDQWNRFTSTLISAKDKIGENIQIGPLNLVSLGADPRLGEAGLAKAAEIKEWLSQRYEDAVAAAAVTDAANVFMMYFKNKERVADLFRWTRCSRQSALRKAGSVVYADSLYINESVRHTNVSYSAATDKKNNPREERKQRVHRAG
ncbi:Dynamin-like 120 kDa protein, mitochondrial [Eumeta japonica]|uniref:Dynamin-like 120 kDa protein, mitochondrial n=1 Tax=Eumeta variegata TaxID=151549 RepID=A0A4C1UUB5_EUMVA|nr:Dynamin-like 120 kDa protein, mitochondrial [Eumeta japonica]